MDVKLVDWQKVERESMAQIEDFTSVEKEALR
jgi:hypothetical protein